MKKSGIIGSISAAALLLTLLAPSSAFATASKKGYIECNSGRQVSIGSTIAGITTAKSTIHTSSVYSYAHYGSGTFSNKNKISTTSWEVASYGTIKKASASCTG